MTRRSFITNLGAIGLFTILPGAGRVWRVERSVISPFPIEWFPAQHQRSPYLAYWDTLFNNARINESLMTPGVASGIVNYNIGVGVLPRP